MWCKYLMVKDLIPIHRWGRSKLVDKDTGDLPSPPVVARSGIYVPPRVSVKNDGKAIQYSIPRAWPDPVEQLGVDDLARLRRWKVIDTKDGCTGVYKEFMALEEADEDRILRFAERWGPLWSCAVHRDCVWSPALFYPELWDRAPSGCAWAASESVEEFQRRARQVNAALDIAACLLEKKSGEAKDWANLYPGGDDHQFDIRVQRLFLSDIINEHIGPVCAVPLRVRWGFGDHIPAFGMETGLGVLRVVWMQVAEVISGTSGAYQCDACGRLYIRLGRKPPAGGRNFCSRPKCKYGPQKRYRDRMAASRRKKKR